jgi:SlyX protein
MMNEPRNLQSRVTELEIQLAHQQRICEQLNEVVTEHTQSMMRYERVILRLEDQIKSLREQRKEQFDPREEKPPHY